MTPEQNAELKEQLRKERRRASQAKYLASHREERSGVLRERRRLEKLSMTPEEHEAERIKIAAYHKEYRARNAELVKAKKSAYNATPEGREIRRLASLRHSRKVGRKPREKLPPEIALERARSSWRNWGRRNRDKQRVRYAQRMETDIHFRLLKSLRSRVRNFVKGKDKSKTTLALLGCTMEEFRAHIEKQFDSSMNWGNYGRGPNCWSLDHIQACNLFDLTKPDQQAKCFHYSNVRPMLHILNIIKGDKLPPGVPHPNPLPLDNSSSRQQRCSA